MAINPKLTFSWLKKTMEPLQPGEVVMAPTPDEMGNRSGQAIFREELARATAVFFTGGDQEAIMKCIHRAGLEADLRASHRKGTVFAGNSAGTAIMSATMIVGVRERGKIAPGNVLVAQGLGLLTKGITDQHVIERQRQERLFSALLRYPGKWGLGIDEGNAVALEEGGRMEVIGTGYVMLFMSSPAERSRFTVRLLEPAVYDFGELLKVQD
jgi:cyanophycinase